MDAEELLSNFQQWLKATEGVRAYNLTFIDMTADPDKNDKVNLSAGLMLSQIIYWSNPGPNGRTRLRVQHEGHLWLAKSRADWFTECRLSDQVVESCLSLLEKLGLIYKKKYKFNGAPTTHVRINWGEFLTKWQDVIDEKVPDLAEIRSSSPDFKDMVLSELPNCSLPNPQFEIAKIPCSITENIASNTSTTITENTTNVSSSPTAPVRSEYLLKADSKSKKRYARVKTIFLRAYDKNIKEPLDDSILSDAVIIRLSDLLEACNNNYVEFITLCTDILDPDNPFSEMFDLTASNIYERVDSWVSGYRPPVESTPRAYILPDYELSDPFADN